MAVDAVILAAGYSSRADGFKMQFELGNKAVLQLVIEAFLSTCKHIVVVGGYQYERLLPLIEPYGKHVRLVLNKDFDKGMFSSVKVGIKEVVSEQFFLTPGDYPLITENICRNILAAKKEFVVPSFEHRGGHPILLPSSCIKELLLEDDESNLKSFLKKKPVRYINVKDDAVMYDIDTKEDYEQLKNRIENKSWR